MAPEHAAGEATDARADLFAAGILTWELLAQLQDKEHHLRDEVAALEASIDSIRAKMVVRRESFARRVRAMYKRRKETLLSVMLTSTSMTDLSHRVKAFKHIARTDAVEIQLHSNVEVLKTGWRHVSRVRIVTRC